MKHICITLTLMAFSFLLGWTSQGYYVYKQFYDAGGKYMQDTAAQVNGDKHAK